MRACHMAAVAHITNTPQAQLIANVAVVTAASIAQGHCAAKVLFRTAPKENATCAAVTC